MTVQEILTQLKSMGNEKMKATHLKNGANADKLLGVKLGDIRILAKKVKTNHTLAYIGIHHPEYRKQALAIGEKLGIYKDYPVSKGCTSPFAPIWINEMVSRQTKN